MCPIQRPVCTSVKFLGNVVLICGLLLLNPVATAQEKIDFNRDIRPILSDKCFHCHGQDANTRQADLRLDSREDALAHGAIVGGDAAASYLVQRIFSEDDDLVMPPKSSNRELNEEQKKLLVRWVEEGAEYEQHWAFVAPQKSPLPTVRQSEWIRNPIDTFILNRLEKEGLAPSPEADRHVLIKRLFADLIGHPPAPEEVHSFVNDSSPNAYETLVDSLMERPQYGERMALSWLDAARYADSNGFQQDGDTWQWMWRDWVVSALNSNLPFNDFATWQLAGDLLPDATNEQKIASGFNRNHMLNGEGGAIAEEQRFNILFDRMDTTSTVFLGLTMACAQCHDHKYDPITQKDYYRLMDAFNRVPESGTPQFFSPQFRVAAPFLEIPTPEVTARLAELDNELAKLRSDTGPAIEAAFAGWKAGVLAASGAVDGIEGELAKLLLRNRIPPTETPKETESEKEAKSKDSSDTQNENQSAIAVASLDKAPLSEDDKKKLEEELRKHFNTKIQPTLKSVIPKLVELESIAKQREEYRRGQMPRPMIMSDSQPRTTHILDRGDYLSPKDAVEFGTPEFLLSMEAEWPKNRLGFARWLLDDKHPLTARVQINRMWQHFFNRGLHKSSEDFGVQSEYPVHKELLDWLAVDFREHGWDMKRMNRMIVTSSTYRQSSRFSPVLKSYDPENNFYARASRVRMPSMVLRDWALASGQRLDLRVGGKPVYPYQPEAVWESLAITKERDFTYPQSSGSDLYRRSLYTFWRRTVGPANMFDSSNRQTCSVKPSNTSTPLHALTTLNDPTWVEASRFLAELVSEQVTEPRQQIAAIGKRVLCRDLKEPELDRLVSAYERQLELVGAEPANVEKLLTVGDSRLPSEMLNTEMAALTAVCLLVFNLDEALTRE